MSNSVNQENISAFIRMIEKHGITSSVFVVWRSAATGINWAGLDGHGSDGRLYAQSWQTDHPPTMDKLRVLLPIPVTQKSIEEICPL